MDVDLKRMLKWTAVSFIGILAGVGLASSYFGWLAFNEEIDPQLFTYTAQKYSAHYNGLEKDMITPEYVEPIYNNVTSNCDSDVCKGKEVYLWVSEHINYVDNYDYLYRNAEDYDQAPMETLSTGRGDCEDFAYLTTSITKNEFDSYVIKIPKHAFTVSCINGTLYRIDTPLHLFKEFDFNNFRSIEPKFSSKSISEIKKDC